VGQEGGLRDVGLEGEGRMVDAVGVWSAAEGEQGWGDTLWGFGGSHCRWNGKGVG